MERQLEDIKLQKIFNEKLNSNNSSINIYNDWLIKPGFKELRQLDYYVENSQVFETSHMEQSDLKYNHISIVVQLLSRLFGTPRTVARQASPSFTSHRACSNSSSLNWWCHPTISSFVIPFSSYLRSFPALGSFLMSQFFTSGGQSIGASTSPSVLPMNIQDWFPLDVTGLISLQFKGLSRIFSNITVQKHQSFGAQPPL